MIWRGSPSRAISRRRSNTSCATTSATCGTTCGRSSTSATIPGSRLDPPRFGIGEFPRAVQEVLERVLRDARQPDEHARVVEVVILQIVDIRFFGDERVAIGEVDADNQRARLG